VIRLDLHVARHLDDGHGGEVAEEIGQDAGVMRVEVLHQHEGHAGGGREVAEEFGEGFQAAGGCAYADNQPG